MGRVRNKIVKTASKKLVEKYYNRLSFDFYLNKRVIDEVVINPSKKIRNQIAGYTTKLMKRIQVGPVKGISLKMQEHERAKKLDYKPLTSELDTSNKVFVDKDSMAMANLVAEQIKRDVEGFSLSRLETRAAAPAVR